jgi:site-specific DNA-methyltransferase (adenine-specific)
MKINKIYNENCIDTMSRMKDDFIDLTVTSPPYDNLRTYNGYSFDFESIAKELYRVTKEGGVVVWIVGDSKRKGSRTLTHFKQSLFFKDIGFNIHDIMIWKKNNVMPYILKNCYTPSYEIMIVLSKGKPKTTNIIREKCKHAGKVLTSTTNNIQSMRKGKKIVAKTKPTKPKHNVWTTKTTGKNYGHPAIFPEKLATDHILSWSNEGDLIYDCFMGSGTTAKMAISNNRNYIGSEMSSEYCDIIKQRLDAQQKELF